MKPYSKDLRLRVLSAVDAGTPREQVAKTFSVSMPTIKRWLSRRRETGDVEPKPIPGRPSRKGTMLKEWLPRHLEANDDLTLEGAIGTSMTVEGATDSEAFEAYVENFLAPTLEKGQVVVLDGLGAHRPKRIRELIEARGADLVFLPSYSPDFNPIEEAF